VNVKAAILVLILRNLYISKNSIPSIETILKISNNKKSF